MEFEHKSVLLHESIEGMNIKPDGIYVDGTLGGAGHSHEICKRLSAKGELICIDQDIQAIKKATGVLQQYTDRAVIVHSNFFKIADILKSLKLEKVDGFLLDLGVSSYQLDEPSRGFSYMNDAPLDMRMDSSGNFSAYDVVNKYDEKKLWKVIEEYGEERWAKRIAKFVVEQRKEKPIETTFELVSVIKKAIPKGAREDGPHPAKRTFQGIRIEVNGELESLGTAVEHMSDFLNPGGRICVITFHSLEDRIIKNTFRTLESPCTCPREFPVCICGKKPQVRVLTRKAVLPSEAELEMNHRARSAKLRIAERI